MWYILKLEIWIADRKLFGLQNDVLIDLLCDSHWSVESFKLWGKIVANNFTTVFFQASYSVNCSSYEGNSWWLYTNKVGVFFAEVVVWLTWIFKGKMWLTKLFLPILSSHSSIIPQLRVSFEGPTIALIFILHLINGFASERPKWG